MDQKTIRKEYKSKWVMPLGWRNRLLAPRLILAITSLLLGIALVSAWLIDRSHYVSTSDAQIAADILSVSADFSGNITAAYVASGDRVKTGDLLYQIDDREARHLLAEYLAEEDGLAAQIDRERTQLGLVGSRSGTHIDASRADVQSARAAVEAAKADLTAAQQDYDRELRLKETGLITQNVWEQAQNKRLAAQQNLRGAEARLSSSSAKEREAVISKSDASLVEHDLNILEAALQRARAQTEGQKVIIEKHQIRSPIDGVVDETFFDAGERTLSGFRVALLHDPGKVWVSANIKETQVRYVKVGALAHIKVDSAPGANVTGRVSVIRDLTVAEAALMPNPNATGVFTKITQRIPVRIELDPGDTHLRPGSMVRVAIERRKAEK
ncbi:HlyD family secretion protein [Hyphomonas sp.]|jgi:membrane fusion protein (multidrug efflux system)|uniref:HlyD family secretion protein n=1 Tax=Hyphomonas sp. TaxID=87 RepID=UPI0039E53DE4